MSPETRYAIGGDVNIAYPGGRRMPSRSRARARICFASGDGLGRIPVCARARIVELTGDAHTISVDADQIVKEVEAFLTGVRRGPEPDRILATSLFTDLGGSTERVVEEGDRRWAELIECHHAIVRQELGRFRGRELDVAGHGFFGAFDRPARAVRCATAIRDGLARIGLGVRAGVHTGECEQVAGKLAGVAVVIGARISAAAREGEILVSSTVRDLVAGSGLEFEERGECELKGVPGSWRLYAGGSG